MCIIMVSSVYGIAYENVTSGTHEKAQYILQWKQVCEIRYQLSEWPEKCVYSGCSSTDTL